MATIDLTIRANSKQAQARVERYNAKVKQLKDVYGALGDKSGLLKKRQALLLSEIKKVSKSTGTSSERFKKLISEYKQVSAQSKKLVSSQKQVGISLKGVIAAGAGIAATVASIRALSRAFTSTFTSSRDFTKQIKNTQTLTDELSFKNIQQGILSLDPVLGTTTELTQGLYNALSAGVPASKAIEFVGSSAKFAKAGLVEANDAVKLIAVSMNAYGKVSYSASKTSDIFFKTIKKGVTTGAELAQYFGKALPIFSSMGVKLEDVAAGFAALTKGGADSATATTQLTAIATGFLKETTAMSAALKNAGYESGEMLLRTEGLGGALEFLAEASGGSAKELSKLLSNKRALSGALNLLKEDAKEFNVTLDEMQDSAGAVDTAFDLQVDAIDKAEGAFRKLQVTLGILIENMATQLAPAAQKISELLIQIDFGALATSIGVLSGALVTYKVASLGAAGATKALSKALKTSVIGAALTGITWGIYKVIDAYNEYQTLLGKKGAPPENLAETTKALNAVSQELEKAQGKAEQLQRVFASGLSVRDGGVTKSEVDAQFARVEALKARERELEDLRRGFAKASSSRAKSKKDTDDAEKKRLETQGGAAKLSAEQAQAEAEAQVRIAQLIQSTAVAEQISTAKKIELLQELLSNTELTAGQILQVEKNLQAQKIILGNAELAARKRFLQERLKQAQEESQALTQYYSEVNAAMKGMIDSSLVGYSTMFSAVADLSTSFTKEVLDDTKKLTAEILGAFAGVMRGIGEAVNEGIAQENERRAEQEEIALQARNEKRDAQKTIEDEKINDAAEREKFSIKNSISSEEEKAKRLAEIDKAKGIKLKENSDKFEEQKKADKKKLAQEQYARDVEAFNVQKGFKLAQTAADTALAIMKVWANNIDPTYVLPGIMTGVISGIAALQLGVIASQKPPPAPKFAMGGKLTIPPGFDGDNFPINVRSGETVTIDPAPEDEETQIPIVINIRIGDEVLQRVIRGGMRDGTIVL